MFILVLPILQRKVVPRATIPGTEKVGVGACLFVVFTRQLQTFGFFVLVLLGSAVVLRVNEKDLGQSIPLKKFEVT